MGSRPAAFFQVDPNNDGRQIGSQSRSGEANAVKRRRLVSHFSSNGLFSLTQLA